MSKSTGKSLFIGVGAFAATAVAVVAWRRYVSRRRARARASVEAALPAETPLLRLAPPSTMAHVHSLFTVSTVNGFLPLLPALRSLPDEWGALESVRVTQMPLLLPLLL